MPGPAAARGPPGRPAHGARALHARAGSVRSMAPGDVQALGALLGMRVKAAHAALHGRMLERLALARPEFARAVLHSLLWQARRRIG